MKDQTKKDAWAKLGIDYNHFIRTTDDYHEKTVQKIFEKLLAQGDIYKHSYTGLYCSGCEVFLNPKDLTEDGCCPIHNKKPEEMKKRDENTIWEKCIRQSQMSAE